MNGSNLGATLYNNIAVGLFLAGVLETEVPRTWRREASAGEFFRRHWRTSGTLTRLLSSVLPLPRSREEFYSGGSHERKLSKSRLSMRNSQCDVVQRFSQA
jgi:hypothetical protein